ncbi:MurT ligase domain-containing protein [uncultured Faecalibaculum sp.]|uniref:MurT ligase domain-containing protein n=1 Tax=uncultured Faecalibaculum sp. TaxID=1729681 RepID=UPI0026230D51|nr:MurT ligase domain-containing protein [uncultured Faecalibaculum sp.]
MKNLSVAAVRLSRWLLSFAGRGGSLPGQIGLKIDPQILSKIRITGPVVVVTGTNGKTSTANLIADLLQEAGYDVVTNRKGDNLREGIATALLSRTSLSGTVKATAAVLETDELNVKYILPAFPVTALVVTNFFRDQLDRAREMEQLIESIEGVLEPFQGTLVLNANDPNVMRLADKAPQASVVTFGVARNQESTRVTGEAAEGKFCPRCSRPLVYDWYQYSHIGRFRCEACGFGTPDTIDVNLEDIDLSAGTFAWNGSTFHNPYEGLYSMYNAAAVLALGKLLGIPAPKAEAVFRHAPQPAGRNETFEADGRRIVLNLVKNPTGANEVMKVIERDPALKQIVIVLNDREQDGRDVSWIYDTHFEKFINPATQAIWCTGTRSGDMGLRMQYGGWTGPLHMVSDLKEAVHEAAAAGDVIYVVATYTALVPARNAILEEVRK